MHRTCVSNRLDRRLSHKSSPKLDSHIQGHPLFRVLFPKHLLQGLIVKARNLENLLFAAYSNHSRNMFRHSAQSVAQYPTKGLSTTTKGNHYQIQSILLLTKYTHLLKNRNSHLKYSRWCRLAQAVQVIRFGLLKSCFFTWTGSQASFFCDRVESICVPRHANTFHTITRACRRREENSGVREALAIRS